MSLLVPDIPHYRTRYLCGNLFLGDNNRMNRSFLILLACSACATLATAQPLSKPLLIEHVRVFDGTRVFASTNVLVEGGIIRSVGPNIDPPAGAAVVDGAGKTLLPGLIDAHTHTIGEATLKQAPIFGVTTDLDMFTLPASAAGIKKQQQEGKLLDYADLRSSGYLATAPGGHGTEYGPEGSPPSPSPRKLSLGSTRGSLRVRTTLSSSMTTLKNTGAGRFPTLSKETMKALTDAGA